MYTKYPISEAFIPKEGLCMIYDNRWWSIEEECLLFFRGVSPQCNSNKSIAERFDKEKEIRFLERVFIPMHETTNGCSPDLEEKLRNPNE